MTTPSWTICTHILLDLIGQTCLFSRDHPFFNHYYDYNYLKIVYNIGQGRMEEPMIFYASIIKILTPSSLTLYGPSIMYKRGGELLAPITKCEKILKNCICRYLDFLRSPLFLPAYVSRPTPPFGRIGGRCLVHIILWKKWRFSQMFFSRSYVLMWKVIL